MSRVLLTGMPGGGKSAALAELGRRGYRVVDTDVSGKRGRRAGLLVVGVLASAAAACAPYRVSMPPEGKTAGVSLAIDATGLGPCTSQWYRPCNYGIRVEGPAGYDHRGNFDWDRGPIDTDEEMQTTNGPVASIGIVGDIPATLGPGRWTISFRLWYGSDAIQLVEVPGGTPRTREEDPFTAACSTEVDTAAVASVVVHVHFNGSACTVEPLREGL